MQVPGVFAGAYFVLPAPSHTLLTGAAACLAIQVGRGAGGRRAGRRMQEGGRAQKVRHLRPGGVLVCGREGGQTGCWGLVGAAGAGVGGQTCAHAFCLLQPTWTVASLGPFNQRRRSRVVGNVALILMAQYAPLVHTATLDAAAGVGGGAPFWCTAGSALALVIAAVMYANGVPERWFPSGRFDVIGSSHQWMHVGIIVAHAFEYAFVRHMLSRHLEEGTAAQSQVSFVPSAPPLPRAAMRLDCDVACSSLWYDYSSW